MPPSLSLISALQKTDPNLYQFLSQLTSTISFQGSSLDQLINGQPYVEGPSSVTAVALSSSPYTSKNNNLLRLISIVFVPPTDPNWQSAQIWVSGYLGNPNFVYITEGSISPVSFLMEMTGENVIFQVVSLNSDGENNLGSAPEITFTLNPVSTPPPAPSIAVQETANATGFKFTFNIESGLLDNVIQAYKIYRHNTTSPTGATVIKTIQSSGITGTTYEFTDTISSGSTYYYWVSTVDTSGNESGLTATFGGSVTFDPSQGTVPIVQSQVTGVSGNQTTTGSYQNDSISSYSDYSLVIAVDLIYNSWVKIAQATLTPNNGYVIISMLGQFYNQAANAVNISYTIYINGVQFGAELEDQVPFLTAGGSKGFSMTERDASPGTSANTYEFWAFLQNNVSNPVQVSELKIQTTNIKK